jgi:hypothetical protein
VDSVAGNISNTWWLTHPSCQFMLSCFVRKDNKDIFTNATDLPGGKTREIARKEKSDSLVEARAVAKVNRPVTYGDVKYQMKKARVDGMASQIDRNKIANINEQIKMMRDQEEMFVFGIWRRYVQIHDSRVDEWSAGVDEATKGCNSG